MIVYKCDRCGYTNKLKSNFKRHLSRILPCKTKLKDISIDKIYKKYFNNDEKSKDSKRLRNDSKRLQKTPKDSKTTPKDSKRLRNCEHCKRSFTRGNNLTRHYARCKVKKKKEENDYEFQKKLKDTIEEMAKSGQLVKIDQPLTKQGVQQNIDFSQNNNGMINNFNIKLNAYDKTDKSHITNNDILKCIKKGNMGIPHMIKLIHCNKYKPENHNVCLNNIKSNYISVYNGDKWNYEMQFELIDMMSEECINMIEDRISEWTDGFYDKHKDIIKKFPDFQFKYYNPKKKYVYNRVHEETKLGLFNNRDIIIKTRNKLLKMNN
jgi:hypothetical protein